MDRLRIQGGRPLNGVIQIGGAKNAALPLMAASLLTDNTLALGNLPHVADIATMIELLVELGVEVSMNGQSTDMSRANRGSEGRLLLLSARNLVSGTAPYDLVRKMRASVLVLGPLLARAGRARVSMPGGCAIGPRPVDLHVAGLRRLGAEISLRDGYIEARAPGGLTGAAIMLPKVSVGATENLMMAACLARGETTITNAACEPEVLDLAHCLIKMGARIEGAGTDSVWVSGVDRLGGAKHKVLPDRIETATYAIAAAITGGTLDLIGTRLDLIRAVADKFRAVGIELTIRENGVRVQHVGNRLEAVNIQTRPYPGFPTDMQAQMMALMTVTEGVSIITENIFENRFMHVTELARMGADISVKGNSATVRGVSRLRGAPVMATDLRASVSLLLAGLAAEGETVVNRLYHLDRGYERVEEKLAACGAVVERIC
ncbi:MAG TPA: UDP-N-acetylglucosamine 1-carboxyvinyltransferase [Alphaproteobacteria bacterium]|nr:UDP-N-acetylglucosamine 1-carboxyvinyltransferase [Alphaproteobacteria bacterium]